MVIARTVWLASYPKSGNTWVRALLTALEEGEALDINRIRHGAIASARGPLRRWLGMPTGDFTAEELAQMRPLLDAELNATLEQTHFRKIHDALMFNGQPIVPPDATLGAIYIVRDPRAVAVSLAHHLEVALEKSVSLMADPDHPFEHGKIHAHPQLPQYLGGWSAHVRGWLEHDLFPVLRVRYEDLHADPARELARIAEFSGVDASHDAITTAVRAAGFERLRAQEAAARFKEALTANGSFFRRGKVEGWREELPEALVCQIEADHAETMCWLGYAPVSTSPRSARP